jgi:hypothetical protein
LNRLLAYFGAGLYGIASCIYAFAGNGMTSACRCECDALRLRNAVLAPQVAVRFHCQRASIFVPKPTRNGRNVHAAFDAARRKQMPQIVVRDAIRADFLRGAIK